MPCVAPAAKRPRAKQGRSFSARYGPMYVYLLRSLSDPKRRYVGLASNARVRLEQHNAGESPHTAKYRPWQPVVTLHFRDASRAAAFEKYLKSGSGHAFARRHFW